MTTKPDKRSWPDGRIAAGEGRTVRLRRIYDAPIDDIWDALTDPERIGRWFLPISGDFRLGGRYQFEGNAGGEIRACAPTGCSSPGSTWIQRTPPMSRRWRSDSPRRDDHDDHSAPARLADGHVRRSGRA